MFRFHMQNLCLSFINMIRFIKKLGPGLLFAGAAIGVSHLVQSTRAGALYSFELVSIVILANILKLPILEMGVRYPSKTNSNLLVGYKDLGDGYFYFFNIITVLTMFVIIAAISVVTAGIFSIFLPFELSIVLLSLIVLTLCSLVLIIGRYDLLDKLVKWIVILLSFTCIFSFFLTFKEFDSNKISFIFNEFSFSNPRDILFLMALVGWMPAPVDTSVWQSLWYEKKKNFKTAFLDFHVGYCVTMILALIFLSLGAMVMNSKGIEFSSSAVMFSSQLVELFTNSIGFWVKPIIAFACLATMISTSLTCLDAYPRVLEKSFQILTESKKDYYIKFLVILALGSFLIICLFLSNMKQLVDFATTISFLVTPIIGYFNFKIFLKIKGISKYDNLIYFLYIPSLIFFSVFTVYYFVLKY